MSDTTSPTLGQGLPDLAIRLDDLYDAATNSDQRTQVSVLQKRVHDLLGPLIDANLNQADADYKAAVAGVIQATNAIKTALSDAQQVAKAINAVASAIAVIDKVLGIVAHI
jgi:hypothetical protein